MFFVSASPAKNETLGRRKKLFFVVITAVVVVVLAFGAAETILRLVPIPGVAFHNFYYDDLTGCRYYPHSSMIYRNERGDYAKRKVNAWGYLDVEHDLEKQAGVTRLGFFGDSYVQAAQFPVEDVFFRLIEAELNATPGLGPVECIAVGVSGYGTYQSYLESRRWADSLGLDAVYYVFCENDVGDNLPAIKRSGEIAYPVLVGDSLAGDFSFRDRYGYKNGMLHRAWQYCKSRSLVCGALQTRLMLLRRGGVKLKATAADRKMLGVTPKGAVPKTTDVPSSWPDSIRTRALEVTERVIVQWKKEVEAAGREFGIIYIPRHDEVIKRAEAQDSWVVWLFDLCARHDIDVIDPSARFAAELEGGTEMFYDHLTRAGHRALADAFVDYYAGVRERRER